MVRSSSWMLHWVWSGLSLISKTGSPIKSEPMPSCVSPWTKRNLTYCAGEKRVSPLTILPSCRSLHQDLRRENTRILIENKSIIATSLDQQRYSCPTKGLLMNDWRWRPSVRHSRRSVAMSGVRTLCLDQRPHTSNCSHFHCWSSIFQVLGVGQRRNTLAQWLGSTAKWTIRSRMDIFSKNDLEKAISSRYIPCHFRFLVFHL